MNDYTKLIEEARNHVEHFPITEGDALRVGRLADALESLVAENENLREANAKLVEHSKSVHATSYGLAYADAAAAVEHIQFSDALLAERDALRAKNEDFEVQVTHLILERHDIGCDLGHVRAERDALRAQLDSMTVEWSAPDTASVETVPFPYGYGADEELARRSAAVLHGPVYRRRVGPWVEVSE